MLDANELLARFPDGVKDLLRQERSGCHFDRTITQASFPSMTQNPKKPQPRLLSLELANFKAFGPKPQTFPLRPITLVFGPNGSGKSSLIHSLLWQKDAWETGNPDVHQPSSAGSSVDLGGFRQFRFKGDQKSTLEVGLTADAASLGFHSSASLKLRTAYSTTKPPVNLRRRSLQCIPEMIAKLKSSHPDWSEADMVAHLIASFEPHETLWWELGADSYSGLSKERMKSLISIICPTIVGVWKLRPDLMSKRKEGRNDPNYYFSQYNYHLAEYPHTQYDKRNWPDDVDCSAYRHFDTYKELDRDGRVLDATKAFLPIVKEKAISLVCLESELTAYCRALSLFCATDGGNANQTAPHLNKIAIELEGVPILCFEIEEGGRFGLRKLDINRLFGLCGQFEQQIAEANGLFFERYCCEFFSWDSTGGSEVSVQFDASSYERYHAIAPRALPYESIRVTTRAICDVASQVLQRLRKQTVDELLPLSYVGPLRAYPDRHFSISNGVDDNSDGRGFNAWTNLVADDYLRSKVNEWLSGKLMTSFELIVDQQVSMKKIEELLHKAFQEEITRVSEAVYAKRHFTRCFVDRDIFGAEIATQFDKNVGGTIDFEDEKAFDAALDREGFWSRMISFAKEGALSPADSTLKIRDLRTGADVSHRDIGVGISQVLPVLVQTIGSREELIAIEQPEIHLHPALQAELGDAFIESAMTRSNRFILETHSEHLILRILRRIRETSVGLLPEGLAPIRPEDVAVLFIEPGECGSIVLELPVTPDGDFARPWPGGFFAERGAELF
jgi:hypothetical protein